MAVNDPAEQKFKDIFEKLSRSSFRAGFRLSKTDRQYAIAKGQTVLKEHAKDLLTKRIGQAEPKNDGKQTPTKGHPVFTAQHATGCCCRSCLQKWHGFEKHVPLTQEQIGYLSELVVEWIRRDLAKPEPKRRIRKGETLDLFNP